MTSNSPLKLLIAGLLAACFFHFSAAANELKNGSFEDGADGFAAGWRKVVSPVPEINPLGLVEGSEEMISLDDTVAREGRCSVKISSEQPVRCAVAINVPFREGQRWRLTAWVKGKDLQASGKQGLVMRLGFFNEKDRELNGIVYKESGYVRCPKGGDFDWVEIGCEATVPPQTTKMAIDLSLWETSGTVWLDDVRLELLDGPAPVSDAASDKGGMNRYRGENERLLAEGQDASRVIFYGDSIVDGWKLARSFPGKNYVNRGIAGQTVDQLSARLDQDVVALHPEAVFFLGGTNDLKNGKKPEVLVSDISRMVDRLRQANIRVIVSSILPVSDYHKDVSPQFVRTLQRPPVKILDANRRLREMCREEGAAYADLYAALANPEDRMPAELADDGLHPNDLGYAKITPVVQAALDPGHSASPR